MTTQPQLCPIAARLEAALQDDMRWFERHSNRQFRMRAATPNDAFQHECDKDERWTVVGRPREGLYERCHAIAEGPVPDDQSDAFAEAWLRSHPHKRDVYAITDLIRMRIFGTGPAPAARPA